MKKIVIYLICLLLCFLFVSCAKKTPPQEPGTTETGTAVAVTENNTKETIPSETVASTASAGQSADAQPETAVQTTDAPTKPDVPAEPAPPTAAPQTTEATKPQAAEPPVTTAPQSAQITFSVRCDTAVAAGNEIALAIAPDGVILSERTVPITGNTTVFDITKDAGLVLGYRDSGYGTYVYSINSLAERAAGAMSGWIYLVNGQSMQQSCSSYVLEDGDTVEWVYTLDGGRDVMN